VFSTGDRERLGEQLVSAAEADRRIAAAATLGSAADGSEDEWSDIDLALCVSAAADAEAVIADWTDQMYTRHGAVHHFDVTSNGALYRVFLLANTLQVDLSFWPTNLFKPLGPRFRLLFGQAGEAEDVKPPEAVQLIGFAWLYALHGRSSIARGRLWQAEYMIGLARDQVLALACLRHGLRTDHARGVDDLPPDVLRGVAGALIGSLNPSGLRRALSVTVELLLGEVDHAEPALAPRLAGPLREIGG
jgi:predicted nucleotidyltransferase